MLSSKVGIGDCQWTSKIEIFRTGNSGRGRPRKSLIAVITEDLKSWKTPANLSLDRGGRRKHMYTSMAKSNGCKERYSHKNSFFVKHFLQCWCWVSRVKQTMKFYDWITKKLHLIRSRKFKWRLKRWRSSWFRWRVSLPFLNR